MRSHCSMKWIIGVWMLGLSSYSLSLENRTIKATELITPFSVLNSNQAGQAVLQQNLAVSLATNHQSTDAQRAKAISDNTIGALIGSMDNELLVADALGPTRYRIYAAHNTINPTSYAAQTFSPHVAALFSQVNTLIQVDASFAKNYFANGSVDGQIDHQATGIRLPDKGQFNVYDNAYHPSTEHKNTIGNSRPVQVAPDQVDSFIADDFFWR
ncbi:hypothetical protein RHO15_07220 [Utexia brackfieldae]|uniref:hypothetical protein n=1 Tax=Utexia brackfieldae TaxID=3074108 RepID=UPI00370D3AD6